MDICLTPYEARVIGCMVEKEITTPEQYPLSLNALTNACNQKSSRDPVMDLDEATVQQTVDALIKKRLISEKTGFGSRVTKYQHRFGNTDFSDFKLSAQELGIICVLLLRGPQTPGELRTRTDRLCKFGDVQEVEATLNRLIERDDGPFVTKFPREPGKRESRYAQLFTSEAQIIDTGEIADAIVDFAGSDRERLDQLEQLVGKLRLELDQVKQKLEQLTGASQA